MENESDARPWDGSGQPQTPLALGDVLSTAFRTIGASPGPLFGLAAAVIVPTALGNVALQVVQYFVVGSDVPPTATSALVSLAFSLMTLLLVIVSAIAGTIVQGALFHVAIESLLGRRATTGEAVRVGLSRFLPLFAANLLIGLAVGVGTFLCLVPGLVAWTWLAVAAPACVYERIGPIDALQRSIDLTEGHRVTILLVWLLVGSAASALFCCVLTPAMMSAFEQVQQSSLSGVAPVASPLAPGALISDALSTLLQIGFLPLLYALHSVMYVRLRGLREGVDASAVARVFA